MDVHNSSIAIAVAAPGRAPPRFLGTTGPALAELLEALGHLARSRVAHGYRCQVIAVTKTPRKPGEQVKTDRGDALSLARYQRAGELTPVTVPDSRDEAIRDLSRAGEDAVRARLKARQQPKAMLLRHGHRYTGKTSWTTAHERYLSTVAFEHPAQDLAYAESRSAVRDAHDRVERLTGALREQAAAWRLAAVVRALTALRGIEFVAAITLVAELGYLGLMPGASWSSPRRSPGGHNCACAAASAGWPPAASRRK